MLPEAAQARKAIWDSINPHTGKRRIDEAFPEAIRASSRETDMFIQFKSGSTWQVVGSDNYNSLVGSPPVGIVFSEYAVAQPQAWDFLRPILAENGGWALFIYTPRGRNHGFDLYTKSLGREQWFTERLTVDDTQALPLHTLEDERREMSDNLFRQEYYCSFESNLDEQVIPFELVHSATNRAIEPIERYRPVWGLDVARFGDDRTCLAKRRANYLLEVKPWKGLDTMQTAYRVFADWESTPERERPSEILVDTIGIGAGVYDRLSELGLPVRSVNVGESSSIQEKYMRLRDEMWFRGRSWFEGKDVLIPKNDELINELTAPTYKFSSSGKIQVQSKDELKKQGMKSPDLADAFLLTLLAGVPQEVEQEKVDRYIPDDRKFRTWMSA